MSRENPTEHEPQPAPTEPPIESTKRPDEYLVQTKRVMDDWQPSKDGKTTTRSTKLVNGVIGPFRNRAIAEQTAAGMCMLDSIISANVITIEDGPAPSPDTQAPASEDVLREMVAQGKVPGVPADATVRVEGEAQAAPSEAPDNIVPFPGTVAAEPESDGAGVRPE